MLPAAVDLQRLAKQREERLALVEYELRVAQEDKAELQVHASSHQPPSLFLTSCLPAFQCLPPLSLGHLLFHILPPPMLLPFAACGKQKVTMAWSDKTGSTGKLLGRVGSNCFWDFISKCCSDVAKPHCSFCPSFWSPPPTPSHKPLGPYSCPPSPACGSTIGKCMV